MVTNYIIVEMSTYFGAFIQLLITFIVNCIILIVIITTIIFIIIVKGIIRNASSFTYHVTMKGSCVKVCNIKY